MKIKANDVMATWSLIYGTSIFLVFMGISGSFFFLLIYFVFGFSILFCIRLLMDFLIIYPLYAYFSMMWFDLFVESY